MEYINRSFSLASKSIKIPVCFSTFPWETGREVNSVSFKSWLFHNVLQGVGLCIWKTTRGKPGSQTIKADNEENLQVAWVILWELEHALTLVRETSGKISDFFINLILPISIDQDHSNIYTFIHIHTFTWSHTPRNTYTHTPSSHTPVIIHTITHT